MCVCQVVPNELVDKLFLACQSNSYEQLEVNLQEFLLEGYSVAQLLSQLFDKIVAMDTISDKQKSVIAERMGVSSWKG